MDKSHAERIVIYTRMWGSGTGLYAQGLVKGVADGAPVTFICPKFDGEDAATFPPNVVRIMPPRELAAGSKLARTLASLRRVFIGLWALLAARATARHFIVSIPDPYLFSLFPLFLLRLSGAEVVFICHDPEPHSWILPPRLRGLERFGHGAIYNIATRIVVLAKAGKAALIRAFDTPEEKIAIIPHGAFELPSVGPLPGSRSLLLLGTLRKNKQVEPALRAFQIAHQRDPSLKLIVAGAADPNDVAYVQGCQALAAQIGPAVSFRLKYLTDAEMMSVVAECDALLLPYADFESQSGVAVLAGMAGRPIIATPAGGIADLIEGGLAAQEIAAPADPPAIAAAIEAFFEVPAETWSARAAAGRKSLAESLDWMSVGRLFRELLAR